MNNQEYYKFLGKLYDILSNEDIIKYNDTAKDLKEKKVRTEKYLEKLQRVQDKTLDNKRYLKIIKQLYYDRYIIKEEDIPNSYLEFLERQYLEQGHGYVNLVNPKNDTDKNLRKEHINTIIKEQKDSLDNWLNYFLSSDSSYLEMWAKVWAFQGMLHIGNINKNKDGYDNRSKTTINPFVSFDSEILGNCVELVKESFNKNNLSDEELNKLLSSGSFAKLYGKLLANKKQIKAENTDGIWIKYNRETEQSIKEKIINGQEAEYIKLYNSLQGYNTGWCTAGSRETAKKQILDGDFYVYYSKDKDGQYKIPRLAIRMQGNSIGEIRGIVSNQNIESNMEEILENKLKEFPDAQNYKKKVSDMRKLTLIYNKYQKKEELTKEDLRFLYEIDNKIEGFGYEKDPRIKEILNLRDKKKDLPSVLSCSEDEIGFNEEDLNRKLKYYEGNLDLNGLTTAEGLNFPEIINGNLDLSGLTSAQGLTLPETINGALDLRNLTTAQGLTLPKKMNGYLDLRSLITAEGLTLPETINGILSLYSLTIAKGLNFPEIINGDLDLNSLTTAEGLNFPEIINGNLDLSGLTSAQGLTLPETINGNLWLNGLTTAEGLTLPETINGSLFLNRLRSAEDLILPEIINGALDLRSLTTAKGLTLPKKMNGYLDLRSLTTAEGLTLPETINGILSLYSLTIAEGLTLPETINGILDLSRLTSLKGIILPIKCYEICIYGKWYELEEVKKMQQEEEQAAKLNTNSIELKRTRSNGFVSNTLLILNLLLLGILSFIITLLIMK